MESAKVALARLKEAYQKHLAGNEDFEQEKIDDLEERFHKAINDDLNMPLALSVVWEVAKNPIKSKKIAELLLKFDTVLGLKIDEVDKTQELPQEILDLVEKRKLARAQKDWAKSDELRDKILELGYIVKDSKDGMEIEKR
jgi:cysteinyl-tRNA synthetase